MNATDFLLRDRAKGVLICGTQYVGVGRCNNSWPPPPPNGALCKINDRGVVCFEGDKLGSADSAYIRKLTLPRGVINLLAREREQAGPLFAPPKIMCAAQIKTSAHQPNKLGTTFETSRRWSSLVLVSL